MLNRFEAKIAITTLVTAVFLSVIDAYLSGGPNLVNFLGPLLVAAAAAAASYLFVRRPLTRLIAAKRQQRPIQIADDLQMIGKTMDEISQARIAPMQAELATARSDLQDAMAKELEFNLIQRIDEQLQNINSTDNALERIISSITEDMHDCVVAALAFRQVSRDELSVASSAGIDQQHRKTLQSAVVRALPSITTSSAPIIWGKTDLSSLASFIPPFTERVIIVPLKGSHQFIGCLMLCISTGKEQIVSRTVRTMKKIGEHSSRLLYRIAIAEEKEENRRRDKLTQAWTRAVLSEKLLELTNADQGNLSLLLIEGDNFIQLNQTIGRERGDELIKTLADTIKLNVKASRTSHNIDAFYRTGAAQFALILENLDDTALYNVAERIRIAVSNRSSWPGDVAQWTVCVGAATPADTNQAGQLLTLADSALSYLKQQNGSNKILFANQLPAKFKRIQSADAGVAGNLQVFDPAELMQSIAIARNTGILRVTGESGTEFWSFFVDGNLKKAKLGTQLRGDNAVIEFICTFEHGNFRFVESNAMTAEGGNEDPRSLGASYDTKDLNRLLMDGALAKDNFATARTKLPNLELYVVAAAENQRPALWDKLKQSGTPPTSPETLIMQEMIKMANGSFKLRQLMQKLDTHPTPQLYHCVSMLLEHQLIRLTAIKTYAYM
jgi:diguanylate cyclase (GGDEF)-like protein